MKKNILEFLALAVVLLTAICSYIYLERLEKKVRDMLVTLDYMELRCRQLQRPIQIDTIDILRLYENTWGDADRQRD